MKKRLSTILIMVLMLAFAAGASAEQQKPIQVWLDGKELAFEVEPLVQNSVTYVEFRSLFEALNYKITYNAATKRIGGTSGDSEHTIEMTIGSSNTIVNGQLVPGRVQPLIQDGRTLVPLRFVGEATGLDVVWDGVARTVSLTSPWPNAKDYEQLTSFLNQLGTAQSRENESGIRALINSNSPLNDITYSALMEHVGRVEIESKYRFQHILTMTPTSTTILATNESVKVSGGFYLNHESNLVLDLSRDSRGAEWKLNQLTVLGSNYTHIEELLAVTPAVSAEEKAEIIGVLEEQIAASNDEDIERYEATFAPDTPELKEAIALSKAVFEQFDLLFELAEVQIIHYDGAEAYVYFSQTTTKLEGPDFIDNRFEGIAKIIKLENGTWRATNETLVLDINELGWDTEE
ncbi:copper amine oxidase N-terminal domain-containing protein [Paenibacillus daejeonensis]|uniref:copper amine oxidase N-terminal domain-containing protein n=1 Tax=Paenibacillus daejeonensis TaxID=135193 RepID=UPI000363126F|nr:copper amine oxidase N-terminal domain-containing protein [Paenibacillus daejeonensis]